MMRIIINIISFVFILASCTEYYQPEIDNKYDNIVVEGTITDKSENDCITLSYTQNFNENDMYMPIKNAKVLIYSNQNSFLLVEESPGKYYTNKNDFKAMIGGEYQLSVTTQDGLHLLSDTVKMMPAPGIDDLTFEYKDVEELYQNSKGFYNTRIIQTYQFYYSIMNQNANDYYFKLKRKALIHSDEFRNTTYTLCWDLWYDYQSDIPIYTNALNENSGRRINSDHIFTISEKKFEDYANLHPRGITLIVEQYSMDKTTYEYYNQIENQIYAAGKFFDPVETQIEGNMICKNNSDIKILGFFSASSVKEYRFYVENLGGGRFYTVNPLDRSPIDSTGCIDNITPSFWSSEYLDKYGSYK